MGRRRYYTTPYSSWELAIHREFPIPVPVEANVTRDDLELFVGEDGQLEYFVPAVAGAASLAPKLADITKKIMGALKSIFGGKYSDRPLIKTRDQIVDLFKKYGYSTVDANGKSIMEKFGLKQAQIDDKSTTVEYYANKFQKLYEYVINVLADNGRGDLVPYFVANTPLYVPGGTKSIPYLEKLLSENKPGKLVNPPGSKVPAVNASDIRVPDSVQTDSGATVKLTAIDPNAAFGSATQGLTPAQVAAGVGGQSIPVDNDIDDRLEAKTQQVVTYVTLGLAVVLLIIAVVVKLKSKK